MPYPAQIHYDILIQTAMQLIEKHGAENVSLRLLAEQLGVKAPSLYRHVKDKSALLRAVNEATIRQLFQSLYLGMDEPGTVQVKLIGLAQAYRAFAHAHPIIYELAYSGSPGLRPTDDTEARAVLPLRTLFAELAGDTNTLPALRGTLALLHGWVTLEMHDNFQQDGDPDHAFNTAVEAYFRGWVE